jgi:O-succinylbenzoate synthase
MTTSAGHRIDVFALPMNVRFRQITTREGILIQGPVGVGEFSPFWDYDVDESASWLAAALEAAQHEFPEPVRDRIPVNCTVAAVTPDQAAAIVLRSGGCTTAKVKVAERGHTMDDDIERVSAVRDALGPGGKVRVDANGGWTVREAAAAISELSAFQLEYVEQPCTDVRELAELRRLVDVPIAADESIRRATDPLEVRDLGAADIAVLKVQPLGGVRACLRIAEQIGMPVVVSSALESSVGIGAGVALAAALPDLPYACGLATAAMLGLDVTQEPFTAIDGFLDVRRPLPDPRMIEAAEPDSDTCARWLSRLRNCERALAVSRRWEESRP